MDYQRYRRSRNLSWEILAESGVASLPIHIHTLCQGFGIPVKYYTEDPSLSGRSLLVNGQALILVNPNQTLAEQRFIAAHELGHILLGHVGEADYIGRVPFSEDNAREQTADIFAGRLLAPACVLWGCGVRGPQDIMELCDVEREVANFRWRRLRELRKRNKFLTSPLEKKVYGQFEEFIRTHQIGEPGAEMPE